MPVDLNFIFKFIVVTAVGISLMKIFGNKGILITIGIIMSILFLIYKFQNKLLYMPGKSFVD